MKQPATPLGQALERLESILTSSSKQAAAIHSMTVARDNQNSVAAMLTREPLIRDAISESCRVWIETGDLAAMDDKDAIYFFDRLQHGEKLLRWLLSGDCQCPNKTPNEILSWLLIDCWPVLGVSLWKDDLHTFLS